MNTSSNVATIRAGELFFSILILLGNSHRSLMENINYSIKEIKNFNIPKTYATDISSDIGEPHSSVIQKVSRSLILLEMVFSTSFN